MKCYSKAGLPDKFDSVSFTLNNLSVDTVTKPVDKTPHLSQVINLLSVLAVQVAKTDSLENIKNKFSPEETKEKLGKTNNTTQKEFNQLNKEGKLDEALNSSPSISKGLRSLTPVISDSLKIVPNIRKSFSRSPTPRSPDPPPSGEVCLLRSENTRLQTEVEETRSQTHYLEVQIRTLRNSLKKSEEAKDIQRIVMQGLERQLRVLEMTTLRLPEIRPLSSRRRNSSLPENLNEVGKRSPLDDGARLDAPRQARRHSVTFSESADFPDFGPHKVILLGGSGVGKSSFIKRLCDDVFSEVIMPSFGELIS